MKRVLFGVDSYFQLIIATNLRTTLYKDYEADIIVYGSVPSAETIAGRLRECGVYSKVWVAETSLTRCGGKYTRWQKMPKYFVYLKTFFSPSQVLEDAIGERLTKEYDEFIFNGFGALPECIFNVAYRLNKNIKCKRIEDGYMSYITVFISDKGIIRRTLEKCAKVMLGRQVITDFVDGYYLEAADLCLAKMPYLVIQAPKFGRHNKELISILNKVFDYKPDSKLDEKQVYLFEDGRHFFSGSNEEMDIVAEITKRIDKEKVIVKMHPRRTVDRWANVGIETVKASGIPWELIQLNSDCTGKALLTVSSAVVFSSSIYFGDDCLNVLLYKCLKEHADGLDETFDKFVSNFREKYGKDSIYIPDTYEELVNIITDKLK